MVRARMIPLGLRLWWPRNWARVALGVVLAGCIVGAISAIYIAGQESQAPKVSVAEGQAAVAATNAANTKGALTAASERRKVEVTIRQIERETGHVVTEAHVKGDLGGALDGWAGGIARLRELAAADPNADPDERPRVSR